MACGSVIYACAHPLSRVQLFYEVSQTSLSMGFPSQEYWSGLPFPSPRDLPHPGIKPVSPALQMDSLLSHEGSLLTILGSSYKWNPVVIFLGLIYFL